MVLLELEEEIIMKNKFAVTMMILVFASITSFSSPRELEKKIDSYSVRLELSEEQGEQIKPVMERAAKERKVVLAQLKESDKKRDQRRLNKELKKLDERTEKELAAILTKEQSKEWNKIKSEVEEKA